MKTRLRRLADSAVRCLGGLAAFQFVAGCLIAAEPGPPLHSTLDLSAGGTNIWELAAEKDNNTGTAGTDFDQLSLTAGNLALGSSSTLLIQFIGSATVPSSTNAFWQTNHTWKIISLSGPATNSGNSNFSAIAGTNDISSGTFSTSVDGSGSIILSYVGVAPPPQPVIEPTITGAGTTNATIRWSAVNGVTYQVQYKDDLNDATWSVLGSPVTATGSTASITDTTNPPAGDCYFYAVRATVNGLSGNYTVSVPGGKPGVPASGGCP